MTPPELAAAPAAPRPAGGHPRPAVRRYAPAPPRLRAGWVVVVAATLLITNVLGFLDLPALLGIPGVLAPHDLGSLLVILFGGFVLLANDRGIRRVLLHGRLTRPVLVLLGLVVATWLSMPLRGEVRLLEAVRLARWFFPLFLFFVVARDVRGLRDARRYERVVYGVALLYTFGTVLYSLAPDAARMLYRGIALATYSDSWGLGVDRHVLKGNNGILFIHLGFLLSAQRLARRVSRPHAVVMAVCAAGLLLQGWRAVMLGAFFGLVVTAGRLRARDLVRVGMVAGGVAALATFVDLFVVRGIVRAKFASAIHSLTTGEGAIGARWARDQVYMIPMFKQRPWFGWGFINKNSGMAADIGLMDSHVNKAYTIYNFDSGYLTLLNMFGVVGVAVFLAALVVLLFRCRGAYREAARLRPELAFTMDQWTATAAAFGIMLIASQHTFAGLITPIGLLPLAWVVGVCQGLRLSADAPAPAPAPPRARPGPRRITLAAGAR